VSGRGIEFPVPEHPQEVWKEVPDVFQMKGKVSMNKESKIGTIFSPGRNPGPGNPCRRSPELGLCSEPIHYQARWALRRNSGSAARLLSLPYSSSLLTEKGSLGNVKTLDDFPFSIRVFD
jgi:hypothetical protein